MTVQSLMLLYIVKGFGVLVWLVRGGDGLDPEGGATFELGQVAGAAFDLADAAGVDAEGVADLLLGDAMCDAQFTESSSAFGGRFADGRCSCADGDEGPVGLAGIATVGVAMAVGGDSLDVQSALRNIASNPLPFILAFAGALIWAVYAAITPSMSGGYDGTTVFFCCVAVTQWIIHFMSGDGIPVQAPGIGGYLALIACAVSIASGYACWGYGMLHGNMETLAVGSYATPVFSTASSTLLLGVALGLPFWIGVVLVVTGSLLNVWFSRRARTRVRQARTSGAAHMPDASGAAN
jgi:uncharacterized membrane protein